MKVKGENKEALKEKEKEKEKSIFNMTCSKQGRNELQHFKNHGYLTWKDRRISRPLKKSSPERIWLPLTSIPKEAKTNQHMYKNLLWYIAKHFGVLQVCFPSNILQIISYRLYDEVK